MNILFSFLFVILSGISAGAQGQVDSVYLNKLVKMAELKKTTDFIIALDQEILIEKSFGPVDQLIPVQSISKSISSLVLGHILDHHRELSLETPLWTWFPRWKNDSIKSKITLHMVLNHTTGIVDPDDIWDYDNTVEFILGLAPTHPPGTFYSYSSGVTSLLAPIVEQITGMTIDKYAAKYIFRPLGITEYKWAKDRGGNVASAGGLWLRSRDLLKIGQLMLHQGQWHGQQIISLKWYRLSISSSQNYFPEYGLQWWLYAPTAPDQKDYKIFAALGHGGQHLVIYPKQSLIIVRTRIYDGNESNSEYKDRYFDECFLAPLYLIK